MWCNSVFRQYCKQEPTCTTPRWTSQVALYVRQNNTTRLRWHTLAPVSHRLSVAFASFPPEWSCFDLRGRTSAQWAARVHRSRISTTLGPHGSSKEQNKSQRCGPWATLRLCRVLPVQSERAESSQCWFQTGWAGFLLQLHKQCSVGFNIKSASLSKLERFREGDMAFQIPRTAQRKHCQYKEV